MLRKIWSRRNVSTDHKVQRQKLAGSGQAHLFSREWGRERRIEWRGNEEVCYEDLELAGGWAVSRDHQLVRATCFFPQHPTSVGHRQRQPLGTDMAAFVLEIKQHVCVSQAIYCIETKPLNCLM